MTAEAEAGREMTRVRYREAQILAAVDLTAEQGYRRGLRERHQLAAHGWGVVYGLTLELDETQVTVEPGVAVDGYGRLIALPRRLAVPLASRLSNGQSLLDMIGTAGAIDVWLAYGERAGQPPRRGQWRCELDQATRIFEPPDLCFTAGVAGEVPPLEPPGADPDQWDAAPAERWPVFIGQLRCSADGSALYCEVDSGGRPQVGLRGERWDAASALGRIEVGAAAAGAGERVALLLRGEDGKQHERMTVDNPGDVTLTGTVRLISSRRTLRLSAGAAERARRRRASLEATLADIEGPDGATVTNAGRRRVLAAYSGAEVASGNVVERDPALRGPAPDEAAPRFSRLFLLQRNRLQAASAPPGAREPSLCARGERGDPPSSPGGIRFAAPLPLPAGPRPWRFYLTEPPRPAAAGAACRELRVELRDPGDKGDRTRSAFVIGRREAGVFTPCLEVRVDGTVIVHGADKLHVGGQVVEGPIRPDPNDPRYLALLQEQAAAAATVQSSLAVIIALTQTAAPHPVTYTFTVTNTGAQTVSGVRIWETVALNGFSARVSQLPGVFDLASGQSHAIASSFPRALVQSGVSMDVFGSAFGLTAEGIRAQGFGKRSVTLP